MENQLVKVLNESGLDKTKAQVMLENFSNYFDIAADWESKAKALAVTSIEQVAEMRMAREGRLFLAKKRVAIEETRKELKESSLREGQTIDAISKVLTNLILPIENDLRMKETFAAQMELIRKETVRALRSKEAEEFSEFIPVNLDFGELDEDTYQTLLEGARARMQKRIEEAAAAEKARAAAEKARAEKEMADKAYRDKIIAENARLAEEARVGQEEMAKIRERVRAQEQLIKDQTRKAEEERAAAGEREKLALAREAAGKKAREDAIKKDQAIEAARVAGEQKAKAAAERKIRNAPDKEKLIALGDAIGSIPLPEIRGEEAKRILLDVTELLVKVKLFIATKVEQL